MMDLNRTVGELLVEPARWTDMDAWHREMGEIRRQAPVVKVDREEFDPFYAVLRHADAIAIERDADLWHNTTYAVLQPTKDIRASLDAGLPPPRSLVQLDGHEHRDHRKVTSDWFKPAAVGRLQPMIDSIAESFVDKMAEMGGRCDFAKDIAQPYTLKVIMEIFGVPEEDRPLMLELTQGMFGAGDPEFMGDAADPLASLMDSVMRFIQYFDKITTDRQTCPTEDLATVIANGMPAGCPMGEPERLWYYIIVATAGHDSSSFALSGGIEALLRDPEQLWRLKESPALLPGATDEIVRWTSPVRHFLRYATADTEVAGVPIASGERVLISYPSTNRDEQVFEHPDTFDVGRPDSGKLLSFGFGTHFCLGIQVARREISTFLSHLLARLEWIEPDGPAEWSPTAFVSGVKHLPISYRLS